MKRIIYTGSGFFCMRLSLFRGATYPNPQADQGEHHFKYALYPHTTDLGEDVIPEGYLFNQVFESHLIKSNKESVSYYRSSNPKVIIETVKLSESGQGIILRLYESSGSMQRTRIDFQGKGLLYETSLDETILESISQEILLKAFEIKTIFIRYEA